MLFINPIKAQKKLVENTRLQRLNMELTQQALAERSGVPLPTLRKFEQKGSISLESFLKLQLVLGGLEAVLKATEPSTEFSSIDDVLIAKNTPPRNIAFQVNCMLNRCKHEFSTIFLLSTFFKSVGLLGETKNYDNT